jgi:hypothetical protein
MIFRNIFIILFVVLTLACGGGGGSSSGTETANPDQQGGDNSNSNNNTSVSDNENSNNNTSVSDNSNQNTNNSTTNTNSNSNTFTNTNSNQNTNTTNSNTNTNQNTNNNSNTNSNNSGSNNPPSVALTDICTQSSLEELINCIRDYIPTNIDHESNFDDEGIQLNKNEHEIPSDEVLNQFNTVINAIFNGECDEINLPSLIRERYIVRTFTDQTNNNDYCLLYEVVDSNSNDKVDKGWGTYVFNPNFTRNIDIQISHPIDDNGTANQGIVIFKEVNARFFQMAGTRRRASINPSPCQNEYTETDVAHNIQNLFQVANDESVRFYENNQINNYVMMQFHKIRPTSCSVNDDPAHGDSADVFLTYGLNEDIRNGSGLSDLIERLWLNNSSWKIQYPGNNASQCNKFGSNNTQSRFINGAAPSNLCLEDANNITEHFIHIEQKNSYLDSNGSSTDDFFDPSLWIESIKSAFPEN